MTGIYPQQNHPVYSERRRRERSESRGFTMIEVLLATMILVVAIGAGVAVKKGSLKSGVSNRHKTQAVGLAQGGLNLVRSIRDTNLAGGAAGENVWLNFGGDTPQPFKLQLAVDKKWSLVTVVPGQEETITIIEGGIEFTREIYVAKISDDARKITAKISWTDFGKVQTLEQINFLTDFSSSPL